MGQKKNKWNLLKRLPKGRDCSIVCITFSRKSWQRRKPFWHAPCSSSMLWNFSWNILTACRNISTIFSRLHRQEVIKSNLVYENHYNYRRESVIKLIMGANKQTKEIHMCMHNHIEMTKTNMYHKDKIFYTIHDNILRQNYLSKKNKDLYTRYKKSIFMCQSNY